MTDSRYRWVVLYTRSGSFVWHASDCFDSWGDTVNFVRDAKREGLLIHRVLEADSYPLPRAPQDSTEAALHHATFKKLPARVHYDDGADRLAMHDRPPFWRID